MKKFPQISINFALRGVVGNRGRNISAALAKSPLAALKVLTEAHTEEAATFLEEQRRHCEEQAAKEARSKELAKARYEKRKAEKGEFTARKKAGPLTPEELEAEEKRLAHNREWQKEWREKRKASEPEKPPKQKSIKELMAVEKTGADLTPEEAERLAAYRRKKADQQRARWEGKKSDQPKKKVS